METKPRNSPITMKLMAVKKELNELDAEISNITSELESNSDPPEPLIEPNTAPNHANTNLTSKFKSVQKKIYQRTPDIINKKYPQKILPKKISQTPNFNENTSLHIEDLMSSDDENFSAINTKTITTPKKIISRQNKNLQENKNLKENKKSSEKLHKSVRHNDQLNDYSYVSSANVDSKSPSQIDEETNRLYTQSVKIVEKRTHSKFNNDPWFQYNDEDQEKENMLSYQKNENNNEDFYFPKQSTFSYNRKSNYKSISEMDRINETQRKREKMALQHHLEKEREIQEECTFKPVLSTPVPVISDEEVEKMRIKKQQRNEENISQSTSKTIRFIDPNSEKIANKAKLKPSPKKQINYDDQNSHSPKVKYLSKKQIKKSCERLSKPKQILTNSDNETDEDLVEEEDKPDQITKRKKKFADPEVIERLFQNSTKPKQSDFNENENQDNSNDEARHSFINSKSREIIEKSAKSRNSKNLFEDSIQTAEEKWRASREIQKYNERRDSDYPYRPKINQTPPHFTVNTTDYSALISNYYSNTPNAKKAYYDAKFSQTSQNSPLRKSYIVSPSPKKKRKEKESFFASEEEINKVLEEVDAQINSLSNV